MNSSQTYVLLMWHCYNPYHSMCYTPYWSMNHLSHVLKYQSYTPNPMCNLPLWISVVTLYSVVFCCTILYLCEYIHMDYSKLYSCLCQAQDYYHYIVILGGSIFSNHLTIPIQCLLSLVHMYWTIQLANVLIE
jgi:hypothetical protein